MGHFLELNETLLIIMLAQQIYINYDYPKQSRTYDHSIGDNQDQRMG